MGPGSTGENDYAKREAYLESSPISTIELFCENR